MPELPRLQSAQHRPSQPPRPMTGGVRVVPKADLRQLHRLLLVICSMEGVDLLFNLWRLGHG